MIRGSKLRGPTGRIGPYAAAVFISLGLIEAIITGKEYGVDRISKYSIKYRWLVKAMNFIFSKLRFR